MPFLLETPYQHSLFVSLARAPIWFVLSTVYAGIADYLAPIQEWLVIPLLAVGFVGAGLVALSLRYYNYWLSWTFWAVPIPAALAALVAVPVHNGTMHPLQALLIAPGVTGAALFGALWLLRSRLIKRLK
jgi:hypothetical protein